MKVELAKHLNRVLVITQLGCLIFRIWLLLCKQGYDSKRGGGQIRKWEWPNLDVRMTCLGQGRTPIGT